ncbi:MAG: hypothetical protein AUG89_11535 [Acidobacteria bacterium 13_1_20CM_4_56_7]|nr:MAG: hypothetical protein AUG89_11535 [Acidobacteria bacterium 13_1_20CM_4_56_7]
MTGELYNLIGSEMSKLDGWTTPERGIEMAKLILETKPTVVVELGVFGGRSFIAQAFALQSLGTGVIYGIDPWKTEAALEGENDANRQWWSESVDLEKIHREAMAVIWRNKLDQHAVIIRASSQHVVQLFNEIDVINIDANHSEIASCRDVELWLPKVKQGGLIWFDDADWVSTQKAVNMLHKSCDVVTDNEHWKLFRKHVLDPNEPTFQEVEDMQLDKPHSQE